MLQNIIENDILLFTEAEALSCLDILVSLIGVDICEMAMRRVKELISKLQQQVKARK